MRLQRCYVSVIKVAVLTLMVTPLKSFGDSIPEQWHRWERRNGAFELIDSLPPVGSLPWITTSDSVHPTINDSTVIYYSFLDRSQKSILRTWSDKEYDTLKAAGPLGTSVDSLFEDGPSKLSPLAFSAYSAVANSDQYLWRVNCKLVITWQDIGGGNLEQELLRRSRQSKSRSDMCSLHFHRFSERPRW